MGSKFVADFTALPEDQMVTQLAAEKETRHSEVMYRLQEQIEVHRKGHRKGYRVHCEYLNAIQRPIG